LLSADKRDAESDHSLQFSFSIDLREDFDLIWVKRNVRPSLHSCRQGVHVR